MCEKKNIKKNFLPFACFWLISFAVIIGRCFYDLNVYLNGDTLVYNSSQNSYDYLLHLPVGYTDFGSSRPLLIFLHGAGEVGNDVRKLKKHDPVHYAKGNVPVKDFPFIVITPITPVRQWQPKKVIKLLDEILDTKGKRWSIDQSRIYLTGFSMGGFGTFDTACEFPERFTAIIPIAGGGNVVKAEKLKNVPTWAFHGNADKTVHYKYSAKMIETMKAANCKEAKLTTLHNADHRIVKNVYSKPEIYKWMLNKK
ncbi:MAG: prolyl oligopeptidase family serine peptidase [Planctomycetaceae bacterium]|jgi:predicted peptidase|nr:prolyl oligopeptidase family serine peptidase [Planctomycetaceae bacterium]